MSHIGLAAEDTVVRAQCCYGSITVLYCELSFKWKKSLWNCWL